MGSFSSTDPFIPHVVRQLNIGLEKKPVTAVARVRGRPLAAWGAAAPFCRSPGRPGPHLRAISISHDW
jgi:hypothetical protein